MAVETWLQIEVQFRQNILSIPRDYGHELLPDDSDKTTDSIAFA